MRVIKKYDNRCLYDSTLSSNITLQDLKQYILDGVQFKVINAKSEQDITRQYLIQIILDLEAVDVPLFSQQSLEQIIRFCAGPQQTWLQQYLEQSLTVMAKQQEMFKNMWANTPKQET